MTNANATHTKNSRRKFWFSIGVLAVAGLIGWLSLSPNNPLPPIATVTLAPGDTFPKTIVRGKDTLTYDGIAGDNLIRVHTGEKDKRVTSTLNFATASKGKTKDTPNKLRLPNASPNVQVAVMKVEPKTERLTIRYVRIGKPGSP